MANIIQHKGVVHAVEGNRARVRIAQMAACAGCKAAATCHASEMKEKLIDTSVKDGRHIKVGDEVTVVASKTTASRALLLAFGLPLVLMLVLLVGMQAVGADEVTTAVVMLASLIPYYIIIWCMRKRIASRMIFWIE